MEVDPAVASIIATSVTSSLDASSGSGSDHATSVAPASASADPSVSAQFFIIVLQVINYFRLQVSNGLCHLA